MIASLIDAMALTICRSITSYWYTISWYRSLVFPQPVQPEHSLYNGETKTAQAEEPVWQPGIFVGRGFSHDIKAAK